MDGYGSYTNPNHHSSGVRSEVVIKFIQMFGTVFLSPLDPAPGFLLFRSKTAVRLSEQNLESLIIHPLLVYIVSFLSPVIDDC